jgi:hypothetical protein
VEQLELEWEFAGVDDAVAADDPGAPAAEDSRPARRLERRAYGDYRDDHAREEIAGSVLRIELDITHPLGFGYHQPELSVMRRGPQRLRAVQNPYMQPGTYSEDLLVAGYLSDEHRERLSGGPALVASRHGPGLVVRMADDYLFRGYWRGTETLFANALFFGSLVEETELPEPH